MSAISKYYTGQTAFNKISAAGKSQNTPAAKPPSQPKHAAPANGNLKRLTSPLTKSNSAALTVELNSQNI